MPVDGLFATRRSVLGYSVSIALLLSAVAGFIDAFGYLVVFHIYTANMSGNSLGFAVALADGHSLAAFERGWPILGYIIGLILGSVIVQATRGSRIRWTMSICLSVEIIFLLAFLLLGISESLPSPLRRSDLGQFALLIAFPTLAMGLQNVTLRKAGGVSIFTTHVTGTLTKMIEDATQFAFWLRRRLARRIPDRLRRTLQIAPRQPTFHAATEMLSLWLTYLAGGICSVLARRHLGYFALLYPIGALFLLMIVHFYKTHDSGQRRSGEKIVPNR